MNGADLSLHKSVFVYLKSEATPSITTAAITSY